MSSKVYTAASNFYLRDVIGGSGITWNVSSANGDITDSSDSTFWYRVSFNSGIPANGSVTFAEDLASQVPWNSTVTSVVATYRVQNIFGTADRSWQPYVRNVATGVTALGTLTIVPVGAVTSLNQTFLTEADGAAWTLGKFYNIYSIGVSADQIDTGGAPQMRWMKVSATLNFTLPVPVVTTGSATGVTGEAATLAGTVNANHTFNSAGTDGYPVTVTLEWGTSLAYGNTVAAGTAIDDADTLFSIPLTGLVTNTTYHYRFKATDGDNTVLGNDQTFVTTTFGDPILMTS